MPRWLPFALFFPFLGCIIYLANIRGLPLWFYRIEAAYEIDKVGHFFLMGTLAWCANHALGWKKFPLGPLSFFAGSVGVLILVSLEELSQYWIPTRTCEWKDLLADVLGIFLIGRLRFSQQRSEPQASEPQRPEISA